MRTRQIVALYVHCLSCSGVFLVFLGEFTELRNALCPSAPMEQLVGSESTDFHEI